MLSFLFVLLVSFLTTPVVEHQLRWLTLEMSYRYNRLQQSKNGFCRNLLIYPYFALHDANSVLPQLSSTNLEKICISSDWGELLILITVVSPEAPICIISKAQNWLALSCSTYHESDPKKQDASPICPTKLQPLILSVWMELRIIFKLGKHWCRMVFSTSFFHLIHFILLPCLLFAYFSTWF